MIHFYKTVTVYSVFFLLIPIFFNAQSSSVFDANYFNQDDSEPPIRVGKGFNITDVFKQTRSCFTPETSHQNKLKPQQSGQKASISFHYTKSDEEFNSFKTKGCSGQVSYLNLFSVGGSKLDQLANYSDNETERLIFVAKVDFGKYLFEEDPILNAESKALINDKKFDDFIQFYGTHYICGVKKESSIYIILTKKTDATNENNRTTDDVNSGIKFPSNIGLNYEFTNEAETEKLLSNQQYNVSVEINGPSLGKNELATKIAEIVNGDNSNKLDAIKSTINNIFVGISDPSQALPTQYYFAPFNLYGLNTIKWDTKKQSNLISINENAIKAHATKKQLEEYLTPTAYSDLMNSYNVQVNSFSKKPQFDNELKTTFNISQPKIKSYKRQLDSSLVVLENLYNTCSDITCGSNENCCQSSSTMFFVQNLIIKASSEANKFDDIIERAAEASFIDAMTPECEKNKKGYIIIVNKSTNPYEIYQGDKLLEVLQGGYQKKYTVNVGTYNFKANQQSGYVMYPTVNNRTANISDFCQEVTLNIGFED